MMGSPQITFCPLSDGLMAALASRSHDWQSWEIREHAWRQATWTWSGGKQPGPLVWESGLGVFVRLQPRQGSAGERWLPLEAHHSPSQAIQRLLSPHFEPFSPLLPALDDPSHEDLPFWEPEQAEVWMQSFQGLIPSPPPPTIQLKLRLERQLSRNSKGLALQTQQAQARLGDANKILCCDAIIDMFALSEILKSAS